MYPRTKVVYLVWDRTEELGKDGEPNYELAVWNPPKTAVHLEIQNKVKNKRTKQLLDISDLGGGNIQAKAGRLQQILQGYFDVRIPLIELPVDDSDKFINPNRSDLFWSDIDGVPQSGINATHLTGRNCKVTLTVTGSGANAIVTPTFEGTN
jgi:hypothetical protein